MPPGRKRGANNKPKTSTNFSLDDLVLAKVKGFPAWPAKVSRPEDWERAPDPKKIFVQFFGTQEIAFITPADVYAFTSESKGRLLFKCRGRSIKYFPQAVNEICEVFERRRQSELDGSSKHIDPIGCSSYASGVEQGKIKGSHAEVKKEHGCEELTRSNKVDGSGSLLGDCPSTEDMSHAHDKQGAVTVEESGGIPDCQAFKKFIRDGAPKESGVPVSGPVVSSSIKEEINSTENKLDRIHSSMASSLSPYGCRPDVELDTSGVKAVKKHNSISLGVSGRVKVPAPGDKKTMDGRKSKDVNVGSKRKHEGAVRHIDDGKSSGRMTDKMSGKVVSSVNGKLLSPGSNNSELNSARKIMKTQMKGQKHLDTNKNSPKNVVAYSKDRRDGDISKKKSLTVSQEQSHSAKKAKHMDTIIDAVKGSVVKIEKNVESVSGDDEAVLPLAKRHRRAVEGVSDVSIPSENKKMHCPSNYKNEVSKKRRAVRLYDDEEEVPKTPVHGGPISSSKVSSVAIAESTKSTDGSRDVSNCNRENLKCYSEDMSMEDCPLPTTLVSESSIAGTSLEKKDSSMKAEVTHSPKIEDLDNQPLRDTNMDLISPLKSPVVVSVNKLRDQQKSNMPSAKGSTTGSHSKARKGSLKGPSFVSDASIPSKVSSVAIPESTKSTDGSRDVSNCNRENLKCYSEDMSMEDCPLPTTLVSESSVAGTSLEKKDSSMKAEVTHSPKIEDLDNQPLRDTNMDLISPLKSPVVVSVNKLRDQQKSNMPSAKGSTTGSHSKARKGSLKGPSFVSDASIPSKVSSVAIPESTKSTDGSRDVSNCNRENLKCYSEDMSMEDCPLPTTLVSESSIAGTSLEKKDSSMKAEVTHSPKIEDLDNQPLRDTNMDLISPLKSPVVVSVNKLRDQQKSNMPSAKGSTTGSHSKARKGSLKGPSFVSDASIPSRSQISAHKSRQPLSGEKLKGTKLTLRKEPVALDSQRDQGSMQGGSNRLEDATDKSASLVDLKAGESSSISIKHLIAAAQARRREALVPNVPLGNGNAVVAPANIHQVRSPSPSSGDQAFQKSGVDNVMQPDAVGAISRGSVASPSSYVRISQCQLDSEEPEEKRLSSTRQVSGGTLSGGTEAAVARDAFEGMIETLSRTKDSIGRATRLAIDCAKYGIANEVVDLLIRKLENETSFHRRVDLFFLVDSITQCSHSQKGIAGASYIPTVQVALPRLLGAAAPSGASARENRRQCLKVLRLWRQRKIFPEYVLKRHMDDIGGTNDDIGSGLSHRRPSRAERSVDDPIREMEGMLVDEYGSNAMFNLPGFLHSRGFVDDEDEDDVPTTTCKESDVSPRELLNSSIEAETGRVSPIDRQHHILEDVDGEFEMEDVSGHLKDGAQSPSGSPKNEKQETYLNTGLESPIDVVFEPLSPEGSPPMPLEPPPALPPLPLSPYPPPPPASWPSPPPPPPTSLTSLPPPPPPPVLTSQPPPPPSFASQPPQHPSLLPPSLLPSGPPQPGHFPPMLPQQPSTTHQLLPQPPSLHAPMQAPLPPDYNIPSGIQPVQMAGNSSQQVPCFTPAGSSGSRDLSGYSSRPFEYGQSDMFPGPQGGHPIKQFQLNQQFQPAFAQRSFPPIPVPQPLSNNFTYNKVAVQQHIPNSHPPPPAHPPPPPPPPSHLYSSASQVQWRSASAEFKLDNQHSSSWLNGGRTPAFPTFVGEAYFRPHERPPPNNVGYQVSAPNPALAGPSTQGHGSLNCWRPV